MAGLQIPYIAILIVGFFIPNIRECTTEVSGTFPSISSLVDVKSNQDGAGGNILDIHLEMRKEVGSVSRGTEEKFPIVLPSATESRRTSVDHAAMYWQHKYLGVHHSTCNDIPKNISQYPKNCKEVQENGNNITGIYEIYPKYSKEPFSVLCDMETKGGGWTHIQKRFDGSQDFFLEWRDYKFGFGDLEGEFWLGLQKIYLLTAFESVELLVEIVDRDNVSAYARYHSFAIGPESGGYKMERLSGFSGDAGDSLTYHLGQKFSTKDLDFTTKNCASNYQAAWWYKDCHISNLNGKYINVDLPEKYKYHGIVWKTYRSYDYCHSKSRMLVRPVLLDN